VVASPQSLLAPATNMETEHGLLSPDSASHNDRISPDRVDNGSPLSTSPQNPFETPYDPPFSPHDEGDIAMAHMDDPPESGRAESHAFSKNDYSYVSSGDRGSTFDSDTRSLLSQAKRYDHHESRLFLLKTGAYRFLITLAFSITIGLTLKAYEGFGAPFIMNKTQVRVFNAIMLGLSLGLGLNLASSLKRYAVILRWYLLTRRYVSLEVFDLILGLETLTKVGKLMIISLPGIRHVKALRKLPWLREARDDGTRFTWIVCLLWILINIGAQVLVAALSLFWPVDPSDAMPLLIRGNVTVANLITWSTDAPDPIRSSNGTQLEAAWVAGMEAMVYPVFALNQTQQDLSSLPGTPLYKLSDGYQYNFYNRDPQHEYTNYIVSKRSVQAKAKCEQLTVNGTMVLPDEGPMYITAKVCPLFPFHLMVRVQDASKSKA
jgi:hypothetical protein